MFITANDILSSASSNKGMRLTVVGEDSLMKAAFGPTFKAKTFTEVDLESFDLVLVPGGVGTFRELYNPLFKKTLATLADHCKTVVTVCTGSALLAKTGRLDGLPATTNKLLFDVTILFRKQVEWVEKARWVQAKNIYTSSGVSAGTDLALQVLQDLYSEDLAVETALVTGYEWNRDPKNDPFVKLIKPPTLFNRLFAWVQKVLVAMIFASGFALGRKMKGITGMLLAGRMGKFITDMIHK